MSVLLFRFDIDPLSGQVTVAACSTYGVRPCLDYDYQPKNYILSINGKSS